MIVHDATSTGDRPRPHRAADRPEERRQDRPRRDVVSFVRRSARMNLSQQRAYTSLTHRYLIEPPRGELRTSVAPGRLLDATAVFGRVAPLVVEIGPGVGDSLVPMAQARPELDVLAFEVFEPAVASLMSKLAAAGVDNVRIVVGDAVQGLQHLLSAASLTEVLTYFPDPWPKARHHKRRLISRPVADLIADRLAPGGRWRLATDWPDYAEWMRAVLGTHPALRAEPADLTLRPITRFEQRGLDAGRPITDLSYVRL